MKTGTYKRVRDNKGMFKKKVKGLLKVMFFGSMIYVAFIAGRYIAPTEQIVNVVKAEDTLQIKIQELKNSVLDDLKKGESSNAPEDDALIILDTNNKASIGSYQFQIDTVVFYNKKIYRKDITRKQAVLISLDDKKARHLADDIIFKTQGGIFNWKLTSKKYDLVSRVTIIKELEK